MTPEGVSMSAHLGDGCTDLVFVKETSRMNYLKFLLRCKDPKADQVGLFVYKLSLSVVVCL